ncbi:M24 family metallopeptidase [Deinococcus radiopugnans]|uniref:Aminopeptidase P family protein n=2 Tax=Deinococcus radiopugnans TaxID=57497 RepID=A0A5C4YC58_9DEIO|nr:Xaa-Pro peptidase family protein [Deinococcus radiopugnans]MBB6015185.1 Xaa-Pro aminopeptidase [Deinococcus radiopugnans ATCC 19172]TNM73107.1 aminopeptidase P family protein [Deinococcus radiopugnans ATCC 19172]
MADLRPDRLTALRAHLAEVDAVLITAPYQLRAFCGAEVSAGTLALTPQGSFLLLDPRYHDAVTAPAQVDIKPYANGPQRLQTLRWVLGGARRIGVYAQALTLAEMDALSPGDELCFVPIDGVLDRLTSLLTHSEIASLQRAETVTRRALEAAFAALRAGVSEREIRQVLLGVIERDSEGPAFAPIVAFGVRTALPHAHPSVATLQPGDLVTMDAGAVVDGLHADLTETRIFGAAPGQDPQAQALLSVVRCALDAARRATRAGATAEEIDESARAPIREAGFDKQTLRGIGHALGYQTHQPPILREHAQDRVQVGQVLALEPGVYLPGVGGVRLEEMVVVGETSAMPIAEWQSAAHPSSAARGAQ